MALAVESIREAGNAMSAPHSAPGDAGTGGGAPLVSICIPTFNNAAMVADALASAMRQTYTPLEILVLDNHSADATEEVVRRTADADVRVHYVRHPRNLGMDGNFNAALSLASGDLVLILCADDILEPSCITVLVSAIVAKPGVVLAACSRMYVDSQLKRSSITCQKSHRDAVAGLSLMLECFARGNVLGEPSAVLFRRTFARRGFNAEYNQQIDLEMWFHLLSQGDAVLIPEVLCRIRKHADQWTNMNIRSGRLVADKLTFFRTFAPLLGSLLSTRQKLQWDARMASSIERTRSAGGEDYPEISAVFFPVAFKLFQRLIPALRIVSRHFSMQHL